MAAGPGVRRRWCTAVGVRREAHAGCHGDPVARTRRPGYRYRRQDDPPGWPQARGSTSMRSRPSWTTLPRATAAVVAFPPASATSRIREHSEADRPTSWRCSIASPPGDSRCPPRACRATRSLLVNSDLSPPNFARGTVSRSVRLYCVAATAIARADVHRGRLRDPHTPMIGALRRHHRSLAPIENVVEFRAPRTSARKFPARSGRVNVNAITRLADSKKSGWQ